MGTRQFARKTCFLLAVSLPLWLTQFAHAGTEPGAAESPADLFDRGLYDEAMKRWRKAVDTTKDAEAAFRLGDIYEAGAIVDENLEEAAKWYLIAAEGGHAKAQFALAAFYQAGAGVAQSDEKAAFWFKQCAERGNPNCQFGLGQLLDQPDSPISDPIEAYKWYYLSAKNGLIEFDAEELVALAERMDQTQKRAAMKRAISFRPLSGPTTATDSSGAD
jgi:TPR repeat protein